MFNLPQILNLRALLETYYNKSIVVLNSEVNLLTEPGENYGGVMLAIDATIKIGNSRPELKKFVAKLNPASQILCDIFHIQVSFQKEMTMYMHAIPAIANFENEHGITEDKVKNMFAKFYGGRINMQDGNPTVDKDAVLLFENLKISGYKMVDRLIGFDKEHTELLIKNLAKFHAVPIAMKKLQPKIFQEQVFPSLNPLKLSDSFNKDIITDKINEVINILKTKDECIPYIQKVTESLKYALVGSYRMNESKSSFCTIVHSDYWVNNTMILYDSEGRPIHNKIVDFQLTMFNSIVYDLLFFLYTSVTPSVLYSNIDYYIKLYYDSFIDRLKKYNIDIEPFSWNAFTKEISEIAPLEIGHIFIIFKYILLKRGIITDISKFDINESFHRDNLSSDYEKKIIDTTMSFIQHKWI